MSLLAKCHPGPPGAPRSSETRGTVFPSDSLGGTSQPTPRSRLSRVQNRGRIDLFRPPGRGTWLWQPGHSCDVSQALRAPQAPWGTLLKCAKGLPVLCPFSSCLLSVLGLGRFTFLCPTPAPFTLEFKGVDLSAEDGREITTPQGCELKFQSSTESSGKESSHPHRCPLPPPLWSPHPSQLGSDDGGKRLLRGFLEPTR